MQVPEDADLPSGLCSLCSASAVDAANFSVLCRKADGKWKSTIELLENLSDIKQEKSTAIYALIQGDQMTITTDVKSEDIKSDVSIEKTPSERSLSPVVRKVPRQQEARKRYPMLRCQCPNCSKKFKYAEGLSFHLKDSPDYKRACFICAVIMDRDDLIKHLKRQHRVKIYDCKKCPRLFHTANKLWDHMAVGHAKGVCTCGDCGRSFQTEHAYNAHQYTHALKTCPSCDKPFRNNACYVYHVRTCCDLDKSREGVHRTKHKIMLEVKNKNSNKKVKVGLRGSALKECICDYCNKKFSGKKFVAAHIQIVHTKDTHSPCIHCGKILAAAHMYSHLKTHESKSESFKCDHCNLVLKTKLGFIQHLRLHTGEKPYKCQHCGEAFIASSRRSEHIRKMHTTNSMKHACDLCPAKFALPFRLRNHMATVHNEKLEKTVQFECPECHEMFSSCRGLIHHSRKHQKGIVRNPKKRVVVPGLVKIFSKDEGDGMEDIDDPSFLYLELK